MSIPRHVLPHLTRLGTATLMSPRKYYKAVELGYDLYGCTSSDAKQLGVEHVAVHRDVLQSMSNPCNSLVCTYYMYIQHVIQLDCSRYEVVQGGVHGPSRLPVAPRFVYLVAVQRGVSRWSSSIVTSKYSDITHINPHSRYVLLQLISSYCTVLTCPRRTRIARPSEARFALATRSIRKRRPSSTPQTRP